jgi:hypothetical protein
VALYERGVIQPPHADPTLHPQDFSLYQALPLLKVSDYPRFDPQSPDYRPPAWMDWSDKGVDSIFGSVPRSLADLVDSYTSQDSQTRTVSVGELQVGDYLCHPDTGDWWILAEEPETSLDDDAAVLVMLRDPHTGEREESEISASARIEVRDLAEVHLAATG